MKIEFIVNDIPPKKSGANSMWNNKKEIPRIIALRKEAKNFINEYGINNLKSFIHLEFTLYLPDSLDITRIGDLDNFVGGILDGLQSANHSALIHMKEELINNEDFNPPLC